MALESITHEYAFWIIHFKSQNCSKSSGTPDGTSSLKLFLRLDENLSGQIFVQILCRLFPHLLSDFAAQYTPLLDEKSSYLYPTLIP